MSEKGKDMNIFDRDYKKWIKDISSRFRRSQIKAATHVNEEMLRFYWSLGRDINFRQNENSYGSDFFRKLSVDMKKELPDVKAFSVTNLHYMVWFYELYPDAINLPQLGGDFNGHKNSPQAGVNSDLYYAGRNSTAERDSVFDGYTACSDTGNHFGAALIALWYREQKEGGLSYMIGCGVWMIQMSLRL